MEGGSREGPLKLPVTVPEGAAPAALLWNMMRMPEPETASLWTCQLEQMIVSRVPYLNAEHLLGRM
jgi:hypothetical protein